MNRLALLAVLLLLSLPAACGPTPARNAGVSPAPTRTPKPSATVCPGPPSSLAPAAAIVVPAGQYQ